MSGNRNLRPVSIGWALLIVLAGSLLGWLLLRLPVTGIDDADIFLVYAHHVAEGHGLVYNLGERVEGFTSLLWVLICSGVFRLTQSVEVPLLALNLLIGSVALATCMRRLRSVSLFLLLVAAAPAWFAWCQLTLMETGLWCMLLTLVVLAAAERRVGAVTGLVPFLVLTRPESMLWCPWLILVMGIGSAAHMDWRRGLHAMAFPLATFAVTLAGLLAFRLGYFGYPLPNTYYAKVSPDFVFNLRSGLGYLSRYVVSNPVVPLVIGVWAAILVRAARSGLQHIDRSRLVALGLLPGWVIPVLVGGDHFGGFRFFQPLWPLLCLLAAWELERFSFKYRRLALVVLLLVGWLLFPSTSQLRHEFRIAREGRAAGAALRDLSTNLAGAPTVAVITAGGVKYAYSGPVLDLMGLNSVEMAHATGSHAGLKNHSAFNKEVFYRWHPDVLVRGDSAEFDSRVLKGLHDEPQFAARYVAGSLNHNGRAVAVYVSRRFLAALPDEVRQAHWLAE